MLDLTIDAFERKEE